MQAELAKLDPKALEQLPKEIQDQIARGSRASPNSARGLPGLGGGLPKGFSGGLPGLGGAPRFPGLPGKKR